MLALGVALEPDADRPAGALSVAALVDAAAQMAIGPERRVRRMVDEFRADGLLTTQRMAGDALRNWLFPSERMLAIDREWLAVFQRPIAGAVPR